MLAGIVEERLVLAIGAFDDFLDDLPSNSVPFIRLLPVFT